MKSYNHTSLPAFFFFGIKSHFRAGTFCAPALKHFLIAISKTVEKHACFKDFDNISKRIISMAP